MRTFNGQRLGFPTLGRIVKELHEASETTNSAFMLVGAIARDVWLYHAVNESPPVATQDADFAVHVYSDVQFDALKQALPGWTEGRSAHELRTAQNVKVDLVPFGGIEEPPGTVVFQRGTFRMNVAGYREALYEAENVLVDDVVVPVLSLSAYGPLKVLAWLDRGEREVKDAEDFIRLLNRYFDLEAEAIANDHADLFDVETFDRDIAGAQAYGRVAAGFATKNAAVYTSVLHGVEAQRVPTSALVKAMGNHEVLSATKRAGMVAAFYAGFEEGAASALRPR